MRIFVTFRLIPIVVAALIAGSIAAECAARLDDLLRAGVPLLANPDPDSGLRVRDGDLTRGRPNGRYKKWHLDAMGFREITASAQASNNCGVVLVMGASETFGLFESPGKEYASLLQQRLLADHECALVINTAVVGMSISSMRIYWRRLLLPLHADVVVLYPSPHFYVDPELHNQAHGARTGNTNVDAIIDDPKSRFLDRLRDHIHKPVLIQQWLNQRDVDAAVATRPTKPLQRVASELGLEMFSADLTALINDIQANGTKVILVVPARRSVNPPRLEDWPDLVDMRRFSPHVPELVFLEFAAKAGDVIRAVGEKTHATLVDADKSLTGCRSCFGDLVHLTDKGSDQMATLLRGPAEMALAIRRGHAIQ